MCILMFICLVMSLVDQMKAALEQKDLDLAASHQRAQEKTELAEQKLASVGTLEAEIAGLKESLDAANKDVTRLKRANTVLDDKYGGLFQKKNELEAYLSDLTKKWYLVLEGMPLLLGLNQGGRLITCLLTCPLLRRVLP